MFTYTNNSLYKLNKQLVKYLFFFLLKKKKKKNNNKFVPNSKFISHPYPENYSHTVVCWLLTHFSYSVAVLCLFEHKIDYQCEIFQNGCYLIYDLKVENIYVIIFILWEFPPPQEKQKDEKKKTKIRKLNVVWNN